ncbi:GNS1/SUR4 family-domain-containing protein [Aspergillus caelatus]|uniref:Elongation of fatty acids protein n=1 Tax=Aspergillus caelatus TaxID=61420 RepID=A0A5N7A1Q5_9EURO|nr:GNS1/SUR4 family-domain-containing protein [Aspergillus caelatus]KAE8363794.1 GNS1/SUR4 family-domain-containing protein [Aspergillus caelatus]
MSVHFGFLPSSLFILNQAQINPTIPTRQLARLGISTAFYTITLPLKFSLVAIFIYTTVVLLLNNMNRRRHGKPWVINQMRWFRQAVILHNILLAFYSFFGAFTIVPGGETLQEFVFIGWTSYMSKFYEFIDTAIILAKGRQASLLHIYHHAGVILVSWALKLQYTYYALISIHVAVPQSAKAAMTAIQIVQFFIDLIVGPSYLYVYYDVSVDYVRCTNNRKMGDSLDTPASRDAGVNGQSYCDIRTVSCMNKAGHTSVAWLGIFFILSLTWMFL